MIRIFTLLVNLRLQIGIPFNHVQLSWSLQQNGSTFYGSSFYGLYLSLYDFLEGVLLNEFVKIMIRNRRRSISIVIFVLESKSWPERVRIQKEKTLGTFFLKSLPSFGLCLGTMLTGCWLSVVSSCAFVVVAIESSFGGMFPKLFYVILKSWREGIFAWMLQTMIIHSFSHIKVQNFFKYHFE